MQSQLEKHTSQQIKGVNMKFNLIKNVVGALAPTLGSALGGPLGGQAASVTGLLELWVQLLLVGLWVTYF